MSAFRRFPLCCLWLLTVSLLLARVAAAQAPPVPVDPDAPITPISELLVDADGDTVPEAIGRIVRVQGVVTVPSSALGDRNFHALIQHFTAANNSDLTRRAIQFHYHQIGAVWGSVADHQRLYRDERGAYAGCTVAHEPTPPGFKHFYRDGLIRPVVPMDEVS